MKYPITKGEKKEKRNWMDLNSAYQMLSQYRCTNYKDTDPLPVSTKTGRLETSIAGKIGPMCCVVGKKIPKRNFFTP